MASPITSLSPTLNAIINRSDLLLSRENQAGSLHFALDNFFRWGPELWASQNNTMTWSFPGQKSDGRQEIQSAGLTYISEENYSLTIRDAYLVNRNGQGQEVSRIPLGTLTGSLIPGGRFTLTERGINLGNAGGFDLKSGESTGLHLGASGVDITGAVPEGFNLPFVYKDRGNDVAEFFAKLRLLKGTRLEPNVTLANALSEIFPRGSRTESLPESMEILHSLSKRYLTRGLPEPETALLRALNATDNSSLEELEKEYKEVARRLATEPFDSISGKIKRLPTDPLSVKNFRSYPTPLSITIPVNGLVDPKTRRSIPVNVTPTSVVNDGKLLSVDSLHFRPNTIFQLPDSNRSALEALGKTEGLKIFDLDAKLTDVTISQDPKGQQGIGNLSFSGKGFSGDSLGTLAIDELPPEVRRLIPDSVRNAMTAAYAAGIDFDDPRAYIKIDPKTSASEIAGRVGVKAISIPKLIGIDEASVFKVRNQPIDFANLDLRGKVTLPPLKDLSLGGQLIFRNYVPDTVRVTADNINKQIYPGLFLQRVSLSAGNIVNPERPFTLGGGASITLGPRGFKLLPSETFSAPQSWAKSERFASFTSLFNAAQAFAGLSLIRADGDFAINSEAMAGRSVVTFLGLINLSRDQLAVNFKDLSFGYKSVNSINIMGLIKGSFAVKGSLSGGTLLASAAFDGRPSSILSALDFLGDFSARGAVNFSADDDYTNDYVGAWGRVKVLDRVPVIGVDKSGGFRFYFNGRLESFGGDTKKVQPEIDNFNLDFDSTYFYTDSELSSLFREARIRSAIAEPLMIDPSQRRWLSDDEGEGPFNDPDTNNGGEDALFPPSDLTEDFAPDLDSSDGFNGADDLNDVGGLDGVDDGDSAIVDDDLDEQEIEELQDFIDEQNEKLFDGSDLSADENGDGLIDEADQPFDEDGVFEGFDAFDEDELDDEEPALVNPTKSFVASFEVPADNEYVTLVVNWENRVPDARPFFAIQDPTGEIYSSQNLGDVTYLSGDDPDLTTVPTIIVDEDSSNDYRLEIILPKPMAGNWDLAMLDTETFGTMKVFMEDPKEETILELADPIVDAAQATVTIPYKVTAPEHSPSTVQFFRTFDGSENGYPISEVLNIPDGVTEGSFTWDASEFGSNRHYIYGVITPTDAAPVRIYANQPAEVIEPGSTAQVANVGASYIGGNEVQVTWDEVPGAQGYLITYSSNAANPEDEGDAKTVQVPELSESVILSDLIPGETYAIDVRTIDEEDDLGLQSDYALVTVGEFTGQDVANPDEQGVFARAGQSYSQFLDLGENIESLDILEAPEGVEFDATSRVLNWLVPEAAKGSYEVSLKVTQTDGNEVLKNFQIFVGQPAPADLGGDDFDGFVTNGSADVYDGSVEDDFAFGGDGGDALDGDFGDDALYGNRSSDQLNGGDGDDDVYGGRGDDVVLGGDGSDELSGDLGDDELWGNVGDDNLEGGDGNDVIYGGQGIDYLWGDSGDDRLFGDREDDVLYGGEDRDTVAGGDGSDELYGNGGEDQLDGSEGDDSLYGGQGDDELTGAEGDDSLYGNRGNDVLNGSAGDDVLRGSDARGDAEIDTLIGGLGADEFWLCEETGTALYDAAGEGDYALVVGFDPAVDQLILPGRNALGEPLDPLTQYRLVQREATADVPAGLAIFARGGDGAEDLIAIVQGVSTLDPKALLAAYDPQAIAAGSFDLSGPNPVQFWLG